MRLFYCLELPRPVQAHLAAAARAWKRAIPGAKWVAEENLHVTVRFLGEVSEGLLPSLRDLGERAAHHGFAPLELTLDRLGAFPALARARVLWIGPPAPCGAFARLTAEIEEGVQALGFPPEEKRAIPHVTLARLRGPQNLAPLVDRAGLSPLAVSLRELTLMESNLRPEGPHYSPLARWPLGR